jgi:predicted CxxxxCH...CXXCH cytochrome family protein
VGGPPPNCNDGNVCTTDSCNAVTGCVNTNNAAACDDGDGCTVSDRCSGGSCQPGSPRACDDGINCTDDSCNPATGTCQFLVVDGNCDDGTVCNGPEVCDPISDCQPGAGPCPVEINPPNRQGGHGAHNALPNVTGVCTTCHSGAGSGTFNHFDGKNDVLFAGTTYDAKTGVAVHNPDSTCSAVSCHGGQTTPDWFTGSIQVNTQCGVCHQVLDLAVPATDQFNSPASGEHVFHLDPVSIGRPAPYKCTRCHDASKLAPVHFNDLNTPAVNEAGQTLKNILNYDASGAPRTCNPSSDQGIGCHFSEPTPRQWP